MLRAYTVVTQSQGKEREPIETVVPVSYERGCVYQVYHDPLKPQEGVRIMDVDPDDAESPYERIIIECDGNEKDVLCNGKSIYAPIELTTGIKIKISEGTEKEGVRTKLLIEKGAVIRFSVKKCDEFVKDFIVANLLEREFDTPMIGYQRDNLAMTSPVPGVIVSQATK